MSIKVFIYVIKILKFNCLDNLSTSILEIANHFQIDENSWKSFEIKDGKLILPQGFATHLLVFTLGTLRGVLHAKTENTEFNKYFLPTINTTEMIQGDLELGLG